MEEEAKKEEGAAEEGAAPEAETKVEGAAETACECSAEATKSAEDLIRDIVNLINVMKEEEVEGVTTKILPAAAEELVGKLEELAKKVGEICK